MGYWDRMGRRRIKDDTEADARWQRRMDAVRMRQTGMTLDAVAKRLGITKERARLVILQGEKELQRGIIQPPSYAVDLQAIVRDMRVECHRITGKWIG